ncbi:GspE/PulE family protein [Stieleria varia]|uniref:Type II secretion system protein E n=1 Tax=Stieleria varia TaxID=2528005 RepID=A0A5C6AGT3_9BACT|nr:ATPase, T2SS/T4P/T4SS family [Stieleria varia]TWT98395.1 Type II secretion system protein E [Stieleria varia]
MSDASPTTGDSAQSRDASLMSAAPSREGAANRDAAIVGPVLTSSTDDIASDLPAETRELAQWLQCPVCVELARLKPSSVFLAYLPIAFARSRRLLGFDHEGKLLVAVCDRDGYESLDVVGRVLGRAVEPIVTTASELSKAVNAAYSDRSSQAQQVIDTIDRDTVLREIDQLGSREDLLDTEGRAPIIQLVNHLLFDAVKAGASDVHIQPYEDRVVVRQRIDGVLFDAFDVPKNVQEEVLSRIKVLGKMNIAEKRLPQDGRATVQLGDRTVDLRIASLPTSHNERIVIRLLDKSARLYTLGELGMPEHYLSRFRELIRRDHGMILVTGPTGSGKSTTLYGALQEINSHDLNVLTLEDPIEYQLDGISQTQINEKKGMTFASGMRSVLRQDPDIIMVGEIRDSETAVMAIQASLTGHLVFSTLHTNDAASAVTRLLDLNIEPYLVSSSLVAALAQRLVRKLCGQCKRPAAPNSARPPLPPDSLMKSYGVDTSELAGVYVPVGCDACRQTGYRGRVGLFELLLIDDNTRELIQSRANASQIRQAGIDAGMHLLSTDGLLKIHQGVTTLDEVLRVTTL